MKTLRTIPPRDPTAYALQWTPAKRAALAARNRQRGLTQEAKRQIVDAARAGKPHIDISLDWLISSSYVSYLATRSGVRRQRMKSPSAIRQPTKAQMMARRA
jgi:hypothetical protein